MVTNNLWNSMIMMVVLVVVPAFVVFGDVQQQVAIRKKQRHETAGPDACVSLLVYKEETCDGPPMRSLTFPTYTEAGSPCCK